ncbi:uncharacterized protein GGS22DRAFT_169813 [Annulohypoxylon maeteangense]|uniref:uncharacterized protein n=1 Tax=Annulohypoxylon maeteangense TaxID=1927788 RepID=UPI0020086823|nr:uncharacterized protein GGS22DRAFT_169813 [Annulohypoxylon maeteangense]KAI0882593.1 hypothetical protein GGS22DRAFT_169813 [Annulohypoxylon maeteangense]
MSHTMEWTETKTKRKRRIRRITRPEVGSLYDILHDHATKALYVSPLGWTDLHTQLLGCQFVPQPSQTTPTPTPGPSQSPSQPETSDLVVSIRRTLNNLMDPFQSKQPTDKSIQSLLTLLYPGKLSAVNPDLNIRCGGGRLLGSVRCQAAWKKLQGPFSFNSATTCTSGVQEPSVGRTPMHSPALAFLDLHTINFARKSCFRVRPLPDGSLNVPIHSLHKIHTSKLVPKNPDEDQYILAIMLAMAQRHVYLNFYTGSGFKSEDVETRVLAVSEQDQTLIVYKSIMPGAFLGMFDDLSKAPRGDARITIHYQRVPVWPILGLKERLGQALGQDLVGEIDMDNIETYQSDPSSSPEDIQFDSQDSIDGLDKSLEKELSTTAQKRSRGNELLARPHVLESSKRKRRIFSDVMNMSFSEDRESSDFSENLMVKRRHLEEGRVGVVR